MLAFLCSAAYPQANPANQSGFANLTGNGPPAVSCNVGNSGQHYTDITNDLQYACRASGWGQVAACSATGPYDAKACGGAHGDMETARCVITAGSKILTNCSRRFTSAMIGEPIYVAGGGGGSAKSPVTLQTTIASYVSDHQITLADPVSQERVEVRGTNVVWGHDDTSALQDAYDTALRTKRSLYIPGGSYLHHGLNFTGRGAGTAEGLIYGNSFASTDLYALAVTDPGSTQPFTMTLGVDLSVASETVMRDVALFGGIPLSGPAFADLAPKVNVFCARQAQTNGNALSILHTWNNVFTETQGPYDVVWDGCEQTNMIDSHFQVDGDNPTAALYLSNVNTPNFASPWVPIIAPGVRSENTMTKLAISGARTSFVGRGNMVVLDEGASNGIYQLSFEDGYAYMTPPDGGGACNFISDTAPDSTYYIRTVKLDQFYIEGTGEECRAVQLRGQAIQWTLIGTQRYPTHNAVANFQFDGGFLASYAQVDGLYQMGRSTPVISAPTCKGSILQLGPMNQNSPGCKDFAMLTNTNQFTPGIPSNGSSLRPFDLPTAPGPNPSWINLGTWVGGRVGDEIHITIDSTGGEQSRAGQQGFVEIAAAIGNTQAAPNITGITGWAFDLKTAPLVTPSGLLIAATNGSAAKNNLSWDIWIEVQPYSFGTYRVAISDGATWTRAGTAGLPPEGSYVVAGKIIPVATGTAKGNPGEAVFVGSLTTSAHTSDTLSSSDTQIGSACEAQPQNEVAATLGGVYLPLVKVLGRIEMMHTPTAGGTFSVFCGR